MMSFSHYDTRENRRAVTLYINSGVRIKARKIEHVDTPVLDQLNACGRTKALSSVEEAKLKHAKKNCQIIFTLTCAEVLRYISVLCLQICIIHEELKYMCYMCLPLLEYDCYVHT